MYRFHDFDVRRLRRRLQLTQKQFCRRFGFELATVRHWERGDRKPSGAALILLNVVRHNPLAVERAVKNVVFRESYLPAPRARGPAPIGRPRGRRPYVAL